MDALIFYIHLYEHLPEEGDLTLKHVGFFFFFWIIYNNFIVYIYWYI
jgi:hypothetical protein